MRAQRKSPSRARVIGLVARKEFVDLARDRRTLITALVVPLLAFPLLFGVEGYFANPTSNPSPVVVVDLDQNGNYTSALVRSLLSTTGLTVSVQNAANLTSSVQSGKYDIGVLIPSGFSSSIQSGGRGNVTVLYDPANGRAAQGVALVSAVVERMSQQAAASKLLSKGVTSSDLNPIGVTVDLVGKAQNASLIFTASLFPSFLTYFTFLGAFYFMVDDIAGEKERRSLEALFTLPPSRTTIFLGKYTVAFVLSMVTSALGLVGTIIGLDELPSSSGGGLSLPLSIFPEIFGIVALAGLTMCAMGFCISTFAKNIREAQQYLSPIFIVFFIPVYVEFALPPSQLAQYASVPLVGITILIRDIILGTAGAQEIALSLAANVATLFVLLWLGIRLLNSERVILRTG
jgi:ABC-type Na+ efflux pump permease subunit